MEDFRFARTCTVAGYTTIIVDRATRIVKNTVHLLETYI